MSSAPNADQIARDAHWLAQALNPAEGVVRLVAMSKQAYRAESFLDDRLLQQNVDAQLLPWPQIQEAMVSKLRDDARWIFHIGHVGSTLVSRLLGEIPDVLALREPRLLRDLAMSLPEMRAGYVAAIPKLMSRTFEANEIALVKATSFVSEIACELVPPQERALLMFAKPRNYVASILAGENSLKELRMLAPIRAQRCSRRIPSIDPAANDAELAAFAWACEMTSLEAAADAMTDRRIAWTDFDSMLGDMSTELTQVAKFFGFACDNAGIAALARGPLMLRYSKDLDYEYSPTLRRDLIEDATQRFPREIDGALAMLRRAAEKSPLLARSLERAGEG
jgi:hypothetical protein